MKFQMPIPLIKSMSLHLAFGVLIFAGMDFKLPQESTEMTISQPVIEAVAVDTNAVEEQVKRIEDQKKRKQKAEEDRIAELERRANEAERKRKQQEQEAVEIEQRNKRQREERKKAEQAAIAARKKQEQEKAKAKAAEAERKRKELERKKAEEQARKAKDLKEAQRKKAEAAEKARQERALQDQLEAEQAVRQQRRSKQVLTEVQKYQALIHQAIQRQLIVDNSMKGKSCQLNVRLASSGLVIQVKELGGDPILCRAAKSAVFKAGTLPVSKEADVYEKLRDINLTVEPEL